VTCCCCEHAIWVWKMYNNNNKIASNSCILVGNTMGVFLFWRFALCFLTRSRPAHGLEEMIPFSMIFP
ncbi:hypothetical protein ACJX0J_010778, partial [Zea mays]